MATRRMFSKLIIDSDLFLDMPLSTQALYFHLAMRADDDGFLNNSKKIMRTIGANQNDYDVLVSKRFIIQFDDGICVIRHWRIHNYIRGDRKNNTINQREMSMLNVEDDNSYELLPFVSCDEIHQNKGIEDGSKMIDSQNTGTCQSYVSQNTGTLPSNADTGKVRLGKDRLGKDSIDKNKGQKLASAQTCYFPNDELLNNTFIDFINMRKTLKNGKMTDRAITMMINKLSKYDNDVAIEMLNQSILNNWKDVYEIKGSQSKQHSQSRAQEVDSWV